jgi:superkiller protein 3
MDLREFNGILFLLLVGAAVGQARDEPVAFKNPQAKEHYQKGVAYDEKGLWAPAILELNQARQLEPGNPDVVIELGVVHGERKEWKEALAMLHKAIAIAPASVRAHYNLALTLDRADPGKGAGIAEYRKVLMLDPQHVDSLINLGVDIGDQNAAEAKPLFERATQAAPQNADAHLNLALLLKRQAEEAASVSEFREAIRLNPDLLEARRQLTALLMTEQQFPQAIEQCREILKRDPDDAGTRYTLGQALIRNQNEAEGRAELAHAQQLRKQAQEKQEAQELQTEGQRDLRAGKLPEALKALTSAVQLDGSSGNHMYLGVALASSGNLKQGLAELETALQLEPNNARAHLNLGSVYLQNGQEFLAKGEFEKALEIDPWFAEAHNNLGMILGKDNQLQAAVEHFRLATELDPQYMEAVFNLGLGLRALNRLADAAKTFRRAVALAPDSAQAQYALGMTLRDMGDAAGAKAALDRASTLQRQSK